MASEEVSMSPRQYQDNIKYFLIRSYSLIFSTINALLVGSEADSVETGWKIAEMVLIKVAGLEVLLVGEPPVSDMPKVVYNAKGSLWSGKE